MSTITIIYIIYIVTVIVSVVIALLLFNLTKLSTRARAVADKRKKEEYSASGILSDESVGRAIFEEISEFVGSSPLHREASKKLSAVFNRELEKRVNQTTQELSKKYEAIINKEKQNEEIAWKKYKKVLSDKEKTEAVIRSIAEGLVVVDAQGKVIMMNPAAEKLLGVSKKEKLGKSVLDSLQKEQLVSLVKNPDNEEKREIELISPQDETKKVLRASSAVIENENGKTIGMVSVLSDITKQKELDRLKSSFVANVSHELRTPLLSIEKSLAMVLDKTAGEVSASQQQLLSIADRNLKRLTLLINDLLDLSKLKAGRLELKCVPSSIERVIDESIEGLISWAETKSINIGKKIQKGLPEVNIDPDRIIQVLNNLIGNAIKFTPNNGNITVEARLKNSQELEVSVQDTGMGITKEDLPRVFDKFFQGGERAPTDISGTGIGLSIAKEIVELHHGKIRAESEKDQGARFTFTLPR